MTKFISLSRAAATAAAAFCACALACALQGAFASPASAFSPALKSDGAGGENTPLNLGGSAASSAHTTSAGGASIVRTIVGLAIVIAVIWGLSWILRQVKAGREGREVGQPGAGLASVAALTLGSGRSVHLVRAGNDYVLLGATEHGVAPIHRYSEEEARDAGLLFEPEPVERSRLLSAASQIFVGRDSVDAELSVAGRAEASPVAGRRPDPMQARMYPPSAGLVGRLRELTVRR